MPREKQADEIFCRSCGEAIKKEAEICPNCGVRNKQATSDKPSTTHDPSQYKTTVSDVWWYGVAGGTGLWILAIILIEVAGNSLGVFTGLLLWVAWVGLPIAAYFDMQYIRANAEWNPNTVIWLILLAVWIVNIIAGCVYLYRRHEVLGKP